MNLIQLMRIPDADWPWVFYAAFCDGVILFALFKYLIS